MLRLLFFLLHKPVDQRMHVFLYFNTRKQLCQSLLQSYFDYAASSWYFGINLALKKKLQVSHNKIVRFILNLGPRDHVGWTEIKKAGFFSVHDRVSLLSVNLVHKIYHGKAPSYLSNQFHKLTDMHHHNTRGSEYNFFLPAATTHTKKCFFL